MIEVEGCTTVDDNAIRNRREQLFSIVEGKAHEKSKDKELVAFSGFLRSRTEATKRKRSEFEATPEDVVDFLVHRCLTGDGRTVVHTVDCVTREKGSCECPMRMGQSAVCALASKLRTRLYELGCVGQWSSSTFGGNPGDSALVHKYVAAVKEEQGRAGCLPVTARQRAMLPVKLREFISRLRALAFRSRDNSRKFLRVLQDLAWFAVQYRSLNRGAELSSLRTENTAFGPNMSCVVFQICFSKVLRGGSVHEFGVSERPGDPTCPVRAMREYVQFSRSEFGWMWSSGSYPVFSSFCMASGSRRSTAVSPSAMARRFKTYLRELRMDDSVSVGVLESLHGLRAGGALWMALKGNDLRDIMAQGFWKSPATAIHYIGMLQTVIGDEFKATMMSKHELLAQFKSEHAATPVEGFLAC